MNTGQDIVYYDTETGARVCLTKEQIEELNLKSNKANMADELCIFHPKSRQVILKLVKFG